MISRKRQVLAIGIAAVALTATACTGSSSGKSSSTGQASGVSASALATAQADLAAHSTTSATAFPITQPLLRKPSAGTVMALLQCASPQCAHTAIVVKQAASVLGVKLRVVAAGASAQQLQQAMDSIIALKPSAVIFTAVEPADFRPQISQLQSMGIPAVSSGIEDAADFPAIKVNIGGPASYQLNGKLLADWTLVHSGSAPSVFYPTPELSFSAEVEIGYKNEMARLCPSCAVRYVNIPLADAGSTAPSLVVSDLQSHPATRTAVFASEEGAEGLPAALKVAGLSVTTVGFAPPAAILQDIKDGQVTAGLGLDSAYNNWAEVDAAARLIAKQPLPSAEKNGNIIVEMLGQKDITFNPTNGFTAFPNIAQLFGKIWSGSNS
jgi:ribose transport system substrate-binding protein